MDLDVYRGFVDDREAIASYGATGGSAVMNAENREAFQSNVLLGAVVLSQIKVSYKS